MELVRSWHEAFLIEKNSQLIGSPLLNHWKTNWRASWTHGPDLPTELAALLALHNERRRIFMEAAQYAMSEEDIQTVLQHPESDDKKTYYHNLLTTSCSSAANTALQGSSPFCEAGAKLVQSWCEAGAKLVRSWREAGAKLMRSWREADAKLM